MTRKTNQIANELNKLGIGKKKSQSRKAKLPKRGRDGDHGKRRGVGGGVCVEGGVKKTNQKQ